MSLITEGGAQCQEYEQIGRSIFQEKPYAATLKLRTASDTFCEVEVTLTPVRGRRRRLMSLVGTCHEVAKPEVPKPFRQSDSESDPNFARMIHDLRNMLLVVVAHADLACESLAREHPSRRHLENVKSAAQSAAALDDAEFRDSATDPRADASLLTTSEPEREETAAGPARAGQAGRLSHTILLVEDESLIRESSVEFLSGAGFHVMAAADGEVALLERYNGTREALTSLSLTTYSRT